MTLDGQIYITGYQVGYDQYEDPPKNNCYLLKLNYDLTQMYAKSWLTVDDERCEFIETTRHGDNLYIAGYVDDGAAQYVVFWHMMGAAFFIENANKITIPAGETFKLRRIIIPNRTVYSRSLAGGAIADLTDDDNAEGARVYFCGYHNNGAENYVFGYLDADLDMSFFYRYGPPVGGGDLQKGGDCALTPNNEHFVGGFST